MKNLAHSASLHSAEKSAPSKPGTKHVTSYFTAIKIEAALSIKKEAPWRALV
jgi:hypothetical protein